ncbi:putative ribonuclease H-like domain-containing protein [Tanacetum coccineum]
MASLKYCDKYNQVGFLKKPEESLRFAEIVDFLKGSHIRYALTHNPTIHDSLVKQFWQTATASTLADGTLELRATIDTLEYTITEASVRSKLQLADASGISMLPNTEIYEEEMNRTVFNCTEEDYGPQKPETSISDDIFSENSVTTNEEVVSEPKEVEPSCVTHVKTPRQQMKEQGTPKVNRSNRNEMMERELGEDLKLKAVRQNVNSVNTDRATVNTGRANVNFVRQNVNSVMSNVNTGSFNVNTGNWGTAVKTSAGYNWRNIRPNSNYNSGSNFVRTDHPLKNMEDKSIFDSGCSGHMTGNKNRLDDFEECKGGSVTFGGSKGYITGKGKIRVGNLDFDIVSFVKELGHFDLFSISQICDKQHKEVRFSWVFFLATKDETSGILQNFIRQIENQLNHKVKIIRSDNGMLKFCGNKGIKKEYSNARTPHQNGVATLIETSRTMLADSLLPTTFWAEAVSSACYIFNRVRVTKPQNKTPYELLFGHKPIISYIRPFGCHVTILDTLSVLGKFDGKCDEGFLVG